MKKICFVFIGTAVSFYYADCGGVGINNPEEAASDVRIFPNPNDGQFTIEFDICGITDLSIEMYDQIGKISN